MNKEKKKFYTKAAALDALRIQKNPNEEVANFLKDLFKDERNDSYLIYFFKDLENKKWFPLFYSNGLFKEIFIGKTLNYLNKMCSFYPVEITNLILELIKDKKINGSFLSILLPNLPSNEIAKIIKTILSLPREQISLNFFHFKKIILKLICNSYQDTALELIKHFIKTHLEKPVKQSLIRDDFYLLEDITKTYIPLLNSTNLVKILEFLEEELKNYIISEYDISAYKKFGSVPSSWRNAIEDHPENSSIKDFYNMTVIAIREILIRLMKLNLDYLKNKLKDYINSDYSIFIRLAVYIIHLDPVQFPSVLNEIYNNKKLLFDLNSFHEIFSFLRTTFKDLSDESKEKVISWMREGPLEIEFYDKPKIAKEVHLKTYLTAIEPYLGEAKRNELETLREKYPSKGRYEGFKALSPVGWVGDISPKKIDDLRNLEMNELVDLCISYEPTEDPFEIEQESRVGLAKEISTLVSESPEKFVENITLFIEKDIHIEYIYYIIDGLEKAWKSGKKFNWSPLLQMFKMLIKKPEKKCNPSFFCEFKFSTIRRKIVSIIRTALTTKEHSIDSIFFPQIRDILIFLCHDPNPTPEYEAQYGGKNMSPSNLMINTIRGSAFDCLIRYSYFYAKIQKTNDDEEITSLSGKYMEYVVKRLLEEKLDKAQDPSPAIHSVFGYHFNLLYYLDNNWIEAHFEDIFPLINEKASFLKAAWSTYLQFNTLNPFCYELLKKQYEFAILKLETDFFGKLANKMLAVHLMTAYWLKMEELEGENYLLPLFFEKAPDEIRAKAINQIYKLLKSIDLTKDSEEWIRLKALWKKRVDLASEKDTQKKIMEINNFTFWLKFIPESIKDCFEIIEKMIPIITIKSVFLGMNFIEYLSNQSNSHPLESIKLLHLYFLNYSGDYITFYSEKERIRLILSNAVKSTSEKANSIAFDLINLLAEKFKIFDYMEFLKS